MAFFRLDSQDIEMALKIMNSKKNLASFNGRKKPILFGQRSHIFEFEEILSQSQLPYFSFFKNFKPLIEKGLRLSDVYIDNAHFSAHEHQEFAEIIFSKY